MGIYINEGLIKTMKKKIKHTFSMDRRKNAKEIELDVMMSDTLKILKYIDSNNIILKSIEGISEYKTLKSNIDKGSEYNWEEIRQDSGKIYPKTSIKELIKVLESKPTNIGDVISDNEILQNFIGSTDFKRSVIDVLNMYLYYDYNNHSAEYEEQASKEYKIWSSITKALDNVVDELNTRFKTNHMQINNVSTSDGRYGIYLELKYDYK